MALPEDSQFASICQEHDLKVGSLAMCCSKFDHKTVHVMRNVLSQLTLHRHSWGQRKGRLFLHTDA